MIKIDKIYIISFVKNIDKQKNIINKLNKLNLTNYEFIYGIDIHLSNLSNVLIYDNCNEFGDKELISIENADSYGAHSISCGIAHFTALQHAYYSNYNNCMILEDDVLIYKDINYINEILSYYPEDADMIKFGHTNFFDQRTSDFYTYYDKNYIYGIYQPGTQCYYICNKDTILKLINNYLNCFVEADNDILYKNLKIYYPDKPIFVDPIHSIKKININDYE